MPWITKKKLAEIEDRIVDLERHFVTRRNEQGEAVQTLADVSVHDRKELKTKTLRGASWNQRKQWLEKTDGGRLVS